MTRLSRPTDNPRRWTDEIGRARADAERSDCYAAADCAVALYTTCSSLLASSSRSRSTLTESRNNMPRPSHLLLCIAFVALISGASGIELPDDVNWPDGQCLDAAEYAGTCKLWKEGYGTAVPAACRGDCDFEQRGPKCYVTGRGCHCNNPCQCTTNGKTNTIGIQCAGLDEL